MSTRSCRVLYRSTATRKEPRMIVHYAPEVQDRRELDSFVRKVYDEHSAAGDRLSRSNYEALVQGGANAVHRFGETFVPRTRDGEVHVIATKASQFAR
ncbi:hypothetical protein SEA_EPONINE_88 [Mycobacterium phage Eponine]|uniref:Uncharacterized protein n=3 Tax=Fionnbharthvirus TaxID=2948708 RepID=A0A6G6XSY9_9CAUD|nr:hypothetical protein I5G69_gp49 [Mycobacterium phage Eponine]QIG61871.1 hypothetical protein SEA_EPONINE_88 [Mycobacterium phage Eponine]